MSEIRSIEYYKEMLEVNPKWLGVQAREMLEHYAEVERDRASLAMMVVGLKEGILSGNMTVADEAHIGLTVGAEEAIANATQRARET